MPQVEDEAGLVAGLLEHGFHAPFDLVQGREQHDGIQVTLNRDARTEPASGFIQRHPPVHADHRTARLAHQLQQGRRPRAKVDQRDILSLEPIEDEPDMGLHVLTVVLGAQAAHPTVKELDGLRPCPDLALQIFRHHTRELVQEPVPHGRLPVHEALGLDVMARGAPLDGIARERERRAGKSDQRHASVQRAAGQPDRLRHEPELLSADKPERVHIRTGPDRIVNDRTFALLERDAQAHWLEREQDVGEDDGRIEGEALDRLQRDLGRQFRRLAHLEDGMLGADGPVLLHVASGLPHEPHRHAVRPFAAARSEKAIVHNITPAHPERAKTRSFPGILGAGRKGVNCGRL